MPRTKSSSSARQAIVAEPAPAKQASKNGKVGKAKGKQEHGVSGASAGRPKRTAAARAQKPEPVAAKTEEEDAEMDDASDVEPPEQLGKRKASDLESGDESAEEAGSGNVHVVDRITNQRDTEGIVEYEVQWEGGDVTWEPEENILDRDLLKDWERRRKKRQEKARARERKRARLLDGGDDGSTVKAEGSGPAVKKVPVVPAAKLIANAIAAREHLKPPTYTGFDSKQPRKSNVADTSDSPVGASREMFRAVETGNKTLAKALLNDTKNVANPHLRFSPDVHKTPLDVAVARGDLEMVKLLLPDLLNPKSRVPFPTNSIKQANDTGGQSNYANYRARAIGAARGGRQGNTAFLANYTEWDNYNNYDYAYRDKPFYLTLARSNVPTAMIDYFMVTDPRFKQSAGQQIIYDACEAGNQSVAAHLVRALCDKEGTGGFGLNVLHLQALTRNEVVLLMDSHRGSPLTSGVQLTGDQEFDKQYMKNKASLTKKAQGNHSINPIHMAAFNPDNRLLQQLCDAAGFQANATDFKGRSPIHFSAACVSPDNLRYLIGKGCDAAQRDKAGITPLILAAKFGRATNIPIIVAALEDKKLIDAPDKNGHTALHYAAHFGQTGAVQALLNAGASFTVQDKEKHTPMFAAAKGGYTEVIKILVAKGDSIHKPDRLKCTPLHHAVKNGHFGTALYLLQQGADADAKDTSGNTPAHYAAGFGWRKCLELVVAYGQANPNAFNDWKASPLTIAGMKSHMSCVDYLLQQDGVDVNLRDSEGMTMLLHFVRDKSASTLRQLQYLIDRKADAGIADVKGNGALHHLADRVHEEDKELADLLLENGADINRANEDGQTPVLRALSALNIPLCLHLLDKGAIVQGTTNQEGHNLLHVLMACLSKADVTSVWRYLVDNHREETKQMAVETSAAGMTPLLLGMQGLTLATTTDPKELEKCTNIWDKLQPLLEEYLAVTEVDVNQRVAQGKTQTGKKSKAKAKDTPPKQPDLGASILHQLLTNSSSDLLDLSSTIGSLPTPPLELFKFWLKKGVDPNHTNALGQTPLMLSISSHAIVTALLEKGADPNICDWQGRSPLMYRVEFSRKTSQGGFRTEGLLIHHGADINLRDKDGRAALHFAFVDVGAKPTAAPPPEPTYYYYRRHQKEEDDQSDPIEIVSDLCNVPGITVDVADVHGRNPLHYAAMKGALICSMYMMQRGGAGLLAKDDWMGNTPLQLALICNKVNYAAMLISAGADVRHSLHVGGKAVTSTFKYAIEKKYMGLAYVMMDKGVDFHVSFRDALGTGKFDLALTLLAKSSSDRVKAVWDGVNAAILLAMCSYESNEFENTHEEFVSFLTKAPSTQDTLWEEIASRLSEMGVDCAAKDPTGRTPLHWAALNGRASLCRYLLAHHPHLVSLPDQTGCTPVMYAAQAPYKNDASSKTVNVLLEKGADANLVRSMEGKTALMLAVGKANVAVVDTLLKAGAKVDAQDSDGCTALMHAVMSNSLALVRTLLTAGADPNQPDSKGWGTVHYLVEPVEGGSYENEAILDELVKAGTDINRADKSNHPPIYYAAMRHTKDLYRMLKYKGAHEPTEQPPKPIEVDVVYPDPVDLTADAEAAAEAYRAAMKAKAETEKARALKAGDYSPIDPLSGLQRIGQLVTHNGQALDVIMNRTDISFGNFGKNEFYRMQLIHNTVQNMYILWTRWGRVGEKGQYQRTPFGDEASAVVEFGKVFRQKTGYGWGEPALEQVPKEKYRVTDIDDGDKPIKVFPRLQLKNAPATSLPSEVQLLMRLFCDTPMLKVTLSDIKIACPLGQISRSSIAKGISTLRQISDVMDDHDRTQLQGGQVDVVAKEKRLTTLSNEFYTLFPITVYGQMQPINSKSSLQEMLDKLTTLRDLHVASRVLLAANMRAKEINPLEYVYRALGARIEPLDPTTQMYRNIVDYYTAGLEGETKYELAGVYAVDRKDEPARFEMHKEVDNHLLLWHGSSLANFIGILSQGLRVAPAGAPVSGYMFGKGIYHADVFKKAFGYTRVGSAGSVLGKSYGCVILSEVVCGISHVADDAQYMESRVGGTDSTLGRGKRGPRSYNRLVLARNGVRLPLGPVRDYPVEEYVDEEGHTQRKERRLNYNEYIVYDQDQVRMRYLVLVRAKDSVGLDWKDEGESEEETEEEGRMQCLTAIASVGGVVHV